MVSGTLFTVSAPSGAGKTSLVTALIEADSNLHVSVSHTTRTMRSGEVDGEDYHFVDKKTFDAMVGKGEFLEHAIVFGNSYGTSQQWVNEKLDAGCDVILEIDWQGASQIKRAMGDRVVRIFILPPSLAVLKQRLTGRGQDDESIIAARMAEAVNEISHYIEADYLVVNDNFDRALADLQAIIGCQHLKIDSQSQRLSGLLRELLQST